MFSRGSRSSGRHARDDKSRRGRTAESLAEELELAEEIDPAPSAADEPASPAAGLPAPAGPYDASEAPGGVKRLDLGSLKIPSVTGVEVRVQANQEGAVQQVYLMHGESALQLGVFAAPRSDPIWDEVRAEIRRSLFADGVAAEETEGEYGVELRARVRTPQGLKDLRFVGVDGPRWLVRAVYQGPAAVDPASAGPLADCLRGLVVDRGTDARPVKEPLPLRLSEQMAEQVRGRAAAEGQGSPAATGATGAGTNGSAPVPVSGAGVAAGGPAASTASTPAAPAGGGTRVGTIPAEAAPTDGGAPPPRRKPSPRPRRRQE